MHAVKALLFLAASASASVMLAERQFVERGLGAIEARAVLQGWSLQASSCPSGTNSCGSGSCCPSSLTCNPAANDEVAACCTNGDCRGAVEGAPVCADSTWNLWKGLNGNGFCCAAGMVGIYDFHNPVAGSCVSSAPAGATMAVLQSSGSGAAATQAPASSASSAPASTTAAPSSSSSSSASSAAAATSSSSASGTSSSASSSSASSTSSAALAAATANSTTSTSSNSTAGSSTASSSTPKASGNSAGKMGVSAGLLGIAAFAAFAL